MTEDYPKLAASAEYVVLTYLQSTKAGSMKSTTVGTASMTFAEREEIESLIAPIMGEYFTGTSTATAYNTAYISRG